MVQRLLYPLLDHIEAMGTRSAQLNNIRPDTILLREKDALLLTYCAPTGIISGSGMRFFDDRIYDPYIPVSGFGDAASIFCASIYYALTGKVCHRIQMSSEALAEERRLLLEAGMPKSEVKRLLGTIHPQSAGGTLFQWFKGMRSKLLH